MKTIVFIGTQKSGSSREAIKSAERLGYYTVLFTDRITFLEKRKEFHDVHLMRLCNLNNIEELKNSIRHLISQGLQICAIVSFVDSYCTTACKLADEFNVNRFSTEAINIMENKLLSRQVLSKSPYSPKFTSLSKDDVLLKELIHSYLPLVMKSPNSCGSKDVFKIDTYKRFKHQMKSLFRKYPDEKILIEEFLDGPQYLIETVIFDNKVHIIAIIEQEISFDKRFIITGYNLMLDPPTDFYNKLKKTIELILESHEMKSGTCHLEMRYVKDNWKLIEINPRISGAGMNKMLEIGLGINLVEETLKYILGLDYDIKSKYKIPCFAQYVVISESGLLKRVTGKNRAKKSPGVKSVYVKPRKGSLLIPPISMGNRYAYVIATGDSEEDAKQNAKQAASEINFSLLPTCFENHENETY